MNEPVTIDNASNELFAAQAYARIKHSGLKLDIAKCLIPSEALVTELQRRNPTFRLNWTAVYNGPCIICGEPTIMPGLHVCYDHAKSTGPNLPITPESYEESKPRDPTMIELVQMLNKELTLNQPMSAKAYQQGCLETESPVDTPEAMDRWNRSWQAGLATFGRIMRCIKQSKLDNLKKYAAYGKLPPINEHLCVVNLDDFLSRAWTPSDFSTVELPKVTDSTTMEELLAMPDACKPFRVMHGLMGIATELEEIFDNIITTALKHQYKPVANNPTAIGRSHTRPFMTIADFDKQNISEELGDMLWYISLICNALGLSLQTIMEQNQIKLQEKRYKKKGYSNESAINRDISAEQQVFAAAVEGSPVPMGVFSNCTVLAGNQGSIPLAAHNKRQTCPDCGGALVEGAAGQQECPTCEAEAELEAPASYFGIVPSSRNRHVFFVLVGKAEVCNLTTGWYFYDEAENEIGPYSTEDEACGKLTEYCNQLGAPVQQQAASPDRACDHCGSPDHIIAFCPSYASLHGTPTKMQQEPVPIPPAPPKRLYKEGDEVKSIRKSLQGVKLVVATDQLGAMVHVREPMVEVANGFHPGTPFDLTSDELVLVKAVAEKPCPPGPPDPPKGPYPTEFA